MKNTLLIFIINLTITPWGVSQNHSISFDGNNDYIAGDFISGDFRTIEFWINADNPINGSTLGTIPINFDSYVRYVAINDFTSTLAGETFSVVGNLVRLQFVMISSPMVGIILLWLHLVRLMIKFTLMGRQQI